MLTIHQFRAMGCPCEIRIPSHNAEQTLNRCLEEIRRFENKYSRYLDDSVVSQINHAAGGNPVSIDEETSKILDYADVCFELSNGKFDITSGVLRTVWTKDRTTLPDESELLPILDLIGWDTVGRTNDSIRLPKAGMEIDLGGIVKEYVADALISLLQQTGTHNALINLGGDIAVTGPQPDGKPWLIGIADPEDSNQAIATIALPDGAITTSGGYERYIEVDGKRFSHLLDPTTGWPVKSLQGVSVVAKQAIVAGSISTIALLQDEKEGLNWLQSSDAPYLAIASDGKITGTLASTD